MKRVEGIYSQHPAFYLLAALVAGIVLGNYINFSSIPLLVVATICYLITIIRYAAGRSIFFLLLGCFLLTGALFIRVEKASTESLLINRLFESGKLEANAPVEIWCEIIAPLDPAPNRYYLTVAIHQIKVANNYFSSGGRARIIVKVKNVDEHRVFIEKRLQPGVWLRAAGTVNDLNRYKNPGMIDGRELLANLDLDLSITVASTHSIEVLARTQSPLLILLEKVRQYLFTVIDRYFQLREAGVLKAAILGNSRFIDKETADNFRASGLYHILVISGSHIALLSVIFYSLFARLSNLSNRLAIFGTIIVIWAYTLIVGAGSPIMRAATMATLALTALAIERKGEPLNLVSIVALIMLAHKPSELFEAGFQLTFISVTLILFVSGQFFDRLKTIGSWRPTAATPYPPCCSSVVKWLAETLYWQPRQFARQMADSPVRYRLEKSVLAGWLESAHLQRPLRYLLIVTATSTIVTIGLLPLSSHYFNRITLIGIVLSLGAELLMTGLLMACVLLFLAELCALGACVAWLVELIVNLFISLADMAQWQEMLPNRRFAFLSYRVVNLIGTEQLYYLSFYLTIFLLGYLLWRWSPISRANLMVGKRQWYLKKVRLVIILITISFLTFVIAVPRGAIGRFNLAGKLQVTFLDVGQGDAAFIRFPDGQTMLIDSGGSLTAWQARPERFIEDHSAIGEQVISRFLWQQGVDHIDYLVVTHSHADHIEGFTDVVRNFSVRYAVLPAYSRVDRSLNRLIDQLNAARITTIIWQRGVKSSIGGVELEVLWPLAESPPPTLLNNNCSLVIRASYGRHSLLFSGDIESEVEARLTALGKLNSDILKVPHHGSRSSSTEAFIAAVKPGVAIFSAPARSPYNHPHQEVVERYRRLGIELFQTGTKGAVSMTTDGREMTINCFWRKTSKADRQAIGLMKRRE